MGLVLPLWVLGSFILAQVIAIVFIQLLSLIGISFSGVNTSVVNAATGAVIYVLTITLVIGLPWLVKKYRTSRQEIGIQETPAWLDFLLAPSGFLVYIVLSAILVMIATNFLTFVDMEQVQDTGFSQLTQRYEYILAFLTLVVIAPIAEEILFRGYLFGKLRQHVPLWIAIIITSLAFGLAHGAWNVGIDVFALSIVLCLLRVVSKSLWPSIMLHMLKNGLAYYLLFIDPTLLTSLGG